MYSTTELIGRLSSGDRLSKQEYVALIEAGAEAGEELRALAERIRVENYGSDIYVRGLIEFSNCCKQDCLYCGIRRGNANCQRYRLSTEEILECCAEGYELGFRTFVLQSGEDPYYSDDKICSLITEIKTRYPDCALTLSLGEKSRDSYRRYYDCGADRYLLRHETASPEHYSLLHAPDQRLETRIECLYALKDIGYQVGCGFMVGSPYQTSGNLAEDLMFIRELNPQMIGIGPFIPHAQTPFGDFPAGSAELTLRMISLLRIMLPRVLLPATTALATIHPQGREKGILAGANVVMPNLSPVSVRKKYLLYDNKACTGEESAQCKNCLEARINSIGCRIVTDRGDSKNTD